MLLNDAARSGCRSLRTLTYPGVVKGVLLFAGECTPLLAEGFKKEDIQVLDGVSVARTKDVHGDWFGSWCDPKVPMRVHVYSGRDEALIGAVLAELQIRAGPPDGLR
jgi:hypothetical protein